MPFSGPEWVSKFQNSRRLEDLDTGFRDGVTRFVAALRAATTLRQ